MIAKTHHIRFERDIVNKCLFGLSLSVILTTVVCPTPAAGQPYGLTSRAPIGPFLNGSLPESQPTQGSYAVVKAFPNLVFFDPTFMVPEPGTNRLYVGCRQGEIFIIENLPNTTNRMVFLDLTARTQGWDDCGLLGMAFHPEFRNPGSTNRGFVYVYYNYSANPVILGSGRIPPHTPSFNRLSRFTVPDGSLVADPNSELVLINQYDSHLYHNGGGMFFGPDGFLYLSNGDEGGANDQFGTAQHLDGGLFSGVLRLDVNQDPTKSHPIRRQPLSTGFGSPPSYSSNYFIPNDNPFLDAGGSILEEFWAIGLRSPHRMTYDLTNNQIWLGDVGEHTVEEVDLIERGGNYQWYYREGIFDGPHPDQPDPLIGTNQPPVHSYLHTNANGCVIGGYIYRGAEFAEELGGKYIFGDNGSGRIWSLTYHGSNAAPTVTQIANMPPGANYEGLSSFGLDQNNELYLCQTGTNGYIYKLSRPNGDAAAPPTLLSQTGTFTNLATLSVTDALIPFGVNTPLWSDGADKHRWMAVPNDGAPYGTNEQVGFETNGAWTFPRGSVLVKHFQIATNENFPTQMRRLETRFLVCDTNGGVYGLTYKWRPDNSDADLLTNSLVEDVVITTTSGTRTQAWLYPSRQDCLRCHNSNAKFILGPKTAQLNGVYTYPGSGVTDNQLRTWNHLGLLNPPLNEAAITNLPAMANLTNTSATLELRTRSYLDANCAHCHKPNGVPAYFDARFDTPLTNQALINGLLSDHLGITGAKVIVPTNIPKSMLRFRLNTTGQHKMPPLGRNVTDTNAVGVLDQWIEELPPTSDLPSPWLHQDVGSTGLSGDASYSSGTFTAVGSGADIYGNADAFHYIYQPITGNVQVVARVLSQQYTDPWAKAGIMFRQSLDDFSRHVNMIISPGNGTSLQFRLDNYDSSSSIMGVTNTTPYWIRLVRDGNIFSGYTSPDGLNWTNTGSVSNPMPATAYVGLAVCAHNNSALNSATFDNVSLDTSPLPSLNPIDDEFVNEGSTLMISSLSAQPGTPTNSLTFHLLNTAPAGMSINPTNGTIQWTPSEAQGPGSYLITAFVMENNNSALISAQSFTVTVNEINQPPILAGITNHQLSLGQTISLTLSATDPDLPANLITFTLGADAPAGMNLNTNSGLLTWTPSALQSPSTNLVSAIAHDDGAPSLTHTQYFTVVVTSAPGATNLPPPWLNEDVGSVEVAGYAVYDTGTFNLAGSGADIFGNFDAFHFVHRPATGDVQIIARVVSLQPTDPWAKAGVMIRRTVDDFSAHTFMAVTPANGVQYQHRQDNYGSSSNVAGPTNTAPMWVKLARHGYDFYGYSSEDGTNWTLINVSSNQMPAQVEVGLAVCSHNDGALNSAAFDNVEVSFTDSNAAPILAAIAGQTILKGFTLSLTNVATDPDIPPNNLAFSLGTGAPAGMLLDGTNGILTWTPDGGQGGTTNPVSVIVTDDGVPPMSATQHFAVVVINTNLPPALTAIGNKVILEGATLMFTNTATDPDIPADLLTFSLGSNAPAGMTLDATNGVLSWTPTGAQSPSSNHVTVLVTDNGLPPLSAARSFGILVLQSNPPPVILPEPWVHHDVGAVGLPGNASFDAGTFTNIGAGLDIYNNYDSFHFIHQNFTGDVQIIARVLHLDPTDAWAKAGVMIRRSTNDFSGHVFMTVTPGHGVNYQHRQDDYGVSDNFAGPTNTAPYWVKLVRHGHNFYGYASSNGTNWQLVGTSSNQMPASVEVGLALCSHNDFALNTATFDNVSVAFIGTNSAPTLAPVANQTILKGFTLSLTNVATDPDLPPDALAFNLGAGAPAGMTLDSTNGILTWTPSGSQGGTTNPVTVIVTDNGAPPLSATQQFSVIVINTNLPPALTPIANHTIVEGSTLTLTNSATDPDVPANALSFSLGVGFPAGMTLDATNGVLSWTPSGAQSPSSNYITVTVTDDGFLPLSASQSFSILVLQSNLPPADLPAPWQHLDVGDTGLPGNAGYDAGTFTNTGAGLDIYNNYDAFHYIYRPVTGDVQIVARVVSLQPTDPWAKAGVMIRRTIDDFSGHVFMTLTPSSGVNYQHRQDDYGSSDNIAGAAVTAPYWVKLIRTGTSFSGYSSSNGADWTLVGSSSNNMPAAVTVGLAVSSHDEGVLNTALFDHVSVLTAGGSNNPPSLDPMSDRAIHAGSRMTLNALANDPDLPADALSFTLLAGGGIGADLNTTNGFFSWQPGNDFANTTNTFTIRVTDNGLPSLSATQSFNVAVWPALRIQSIDLTGAVVTLTWSTIPGSNYFVQSSPDAALSTWTNLSGTVTAPGPSASKQDALGETLRYYRVKQAP